MSVAVEQGQQVVLDGSTFDLSYVAIGLGWDLHQTNLGVFHRFLGKKTVPFDLDLACFLLDSEDKVRELGSDYLVGGDVIFFSNKLHHSGKIWLSDDNRTGDGDGDDEQIVARLHTISPDIHRLLFVATIYEGQKNDQDFSKVKNAFIRAMDASGKEILRYNLSGASYRNKRTLLFAEVYRAGEKWVFNALGEGYEFDSFTHLLKKYVRR